MITTQVKPSFLFYTFTLFVCLNSFFLNNADAQTEQYEVQFPGSVRTEGYNINADLSVVGHYETSDGRIHSFAARLADTAAPEEVEGAEAKN